jgi:hypothetical protein
VVPAGLDDDAEADGDDAEGDDAEADEDGDEPGEDEEDPVADGPPATGSFLWAGDDLGCADCNGDGLAVTKPNGWPAQGTAFPAGPVSASDPMAPTSAADTADPAALAAGEHEAGVGRVDAVPDAVGAAGPVPWTR